MEALTKKTPPRDLLFITVCMAVCFALRFDFLHASNWVIDSDEGVVGLMAKHIADGRTIPIFYYGQQYMGSFEAICAAAFFRIFGVSAVALKSVPLIFSIAIVPLMYLLAQSIGGKIAGRTAALLWSVPPSPLVIWSAMARGGFIEVIWIGATALWLTVRWLKNDRPTYFSLFVLALVLGFGWWTNNQIIYFAVPIGFFIFCRLLLQPVAVVKVFIATIVGGVGFFTGSLPFWLYNFTHSYASFGILERAKISEIPSHVKGLVETALPILLGAKRFWHEQDEFPGASVIVLTFFAMLFLGIIVIRRKQIAALMLFRIDRRKPVELFVLCIATAVGVFVCSSFGHLVLAPRYLLPLYVSVYVLVGFVVSLLWTSSKVGASAVVGAILACNLASSYLGGRALPGQPWVAFNQRASLDHEGILSWLADNHVQFVRTNYWIGYRLAFESAETVRFVLFQEPRQIRLPEYEAAASAISPAEIPFVLVPAQEPLVAQALDVAGYSYERAQASGYEILYDVHSRIAAPGVLPLFHFGDAESDSLRPVPDSNFTIDTNTHGSDIALASDGNTGTRWGTGEPQHPGMDVRLLFTAPTTVRGLYYNIDQWATDYPRGLTVTVTTPTGENKTVLSDQQYRSMRYLTEAIPHWRIAFDPIVASQIVLTETGSDSFFDWSIGEVDPLQ